MEEEQQIEKRFQTPQAASLLPLIAAKGCGARALHQPNHSVLIAFIALLLLLLVLLLLLLLLLLLCSV